MAYISNKLTHWIGGGEKSTKRQYSLLKKILNEKMLLFGSPRWSHSKKYPDLKAKRVSMISFTDIPLSESELHCRKYSKFGISFNKAYLANCHATPVGYMQNPWLEGNINFIVKALNALKSILKRMGSEKWTFDGFRRKEIETASVDSILMLLKTILFTTEDYSGKRGFKYSNKKADPLPGQEKFFEDPRALYFEREWRIIYTTLLKIEHKIHIVEAGPGKKKFLKFDEKYIEYIILPKKYMQNLAKDRKSIFSGYNKKNIPKVIAFEDLKYI